MLLDLRELKSGWILQGSIVNRSYSLIIMTPWNPPLDYMAPVARFQLVAGDLLKFMAANDNDHPLMIHGFSVAGYIWGELCVHVMKDPER